MDLAAVICDDQPARAVGAATRPLAESWSCTTGTESIGVYVFASLADRDQSLERLLTYFASTGDTRPLGDFPFVCGDSWTIETGFPAVRDRVLAALGAGGIAAAPC